LSNESPQTDRTGEWSVETGIFSALDPALIPEAEGAPGAGADAGGSKPPETGDDPYNKTIPPVLETPAKPMRRSLDDMRRLSEEIKAGRTRK